MFTNGLDPDSELSMSLTAEVGYLVRLISFDLGNYGPEITLDNVTVRDENDQAVYSLEDVVVPDATNPTPVHFDFGTGLLGKKLTLTVNLTETGESSDNICLDNIQFGQRSDSPIPSRDAVGEVSKQAATEESSWGEIKGLFR